MLNDAETEAVQSEAMLEARKLSLYGDKFWRHVRGAIQSARRDSGMIGKPDNPRLAGLR